MAAETGLEVHSAGGVRRLRPVDAPCTVGRGDASDVVVPGASVSRAHLRLDHDAAGWSVHDLSTYGTFDEAGRTVDSRLLDRPTVLRLGDADGPAVTLVPATAAAERPAEPSAEASAEATVDLDERALRLRVDETVHLAQPGTSVTVGRDDGCDVVVDAARAEVSRVHARFVWDDGWTVADAGSTRGTFVDGRRVRRPVPVRGAVTIHLGDPTAGTAVQCLTGGTHTPRRRVLPAVVAAVVALVVAAGLVLVPRGADGPNSDAQRAAARAATVRIEVIDEDLQRLGVQGSGVLVSADGLVLTNAHVAYATTHAERVGQEPLAADAVLLAVGFASTDGGAVDRFYVAEPVALHPFHDVALLRIVGDGNGATPFALDADPLAVGSSSELTAGDLVDQFGYPGVAGTLRVSVATRNLQSVAPCLLPPVDDCLEDREDGWLNLSGQPLGGGASGGPIVRDGRVVGINQGAVRVDDRTVEQNRAVPIDLVVEHLPLECTGC